MFLAWIHIVDSEASALLRILQLCIYRKSFGGNKDIDGAGTGHNGAHLMIKKSKLVQNGRTEKPIEPREILTLAPNLGIYAGKERKIYSN